VVAQPLTIVDEFDCGLGWSVDEFMRRTSHALVVDARVWLVDPVAASDAIFERIEQLGTPAGVVQLLDRHDRDCARLASQLGVPHVAAYAGAGDVPFEVVSIRRWRVWRESALWWPEQAVLVCADVLGTISYFRSPQDRIGVHPLLRLFPPRILGRFEPRRILVGHGEGIHEDAAGALREALATSRRRAYGVLAGAVAARRDNRRGRDV
jgi:hypothetical protein